MTSYEAMAAGASTPTVNTESLPEFKFHNPGDEVFGQVTRAQFGIQTKFGEGNLVDVNDHRFGAVTVWLGNVQLKSGLVDGNNQLGRQVQPGDIVFIRFDSVTPLDGGKTVKNFSINLQAGAQQAAQQAQPAAAPQQPVQPQSPVQAPVQPAQAPVQPQAPVQAPAQPQQVTGAMPF